MVLQTTLKGWLENTRIGFCDLRRPVPGVVVSLFDTHGLSLLPWKMRGYRCVLILEKSSSRKPLAFTGIEVVVINNIDEESILKTLPDAREVAFVIGLPPCRDLCSAGARWWKKKFAKDNGFQKRAIQTLNRLLDMLDNFGVPYAILVPASSRTLLNRPCQRVSPHEFGRYLPHKSPHPLFPNVIPPNDAYTKRTFLYGGCGFVLPWKAAVPPVFTKILLKSGKTKRITPIMASRKSTQTRCIAPFGLCSAIAQVHCSSNYV